MSLYKVNQIVGKGTYPKVIWPIFVHEDESFLGYLSANDIS
jgi:hypothetical protein